MSELFCDDYRLTTFTQFRVGDRVRVNRNCKYRTGLHGVVDECLSYTIDPQSNESITGLARYGVRMLDDGHVVDFRRYELSRAPKEARP